MASLFPSLRYSPTNVVVSVTRASPSEAWVLWSGAAQKSGSPAPELLVHPVGRPPL